ncbi:MAG: hypothetical protein C4522_01235 [Desulfobacteraceae bacterium]|nr:MAG: hypothetical protein C4522_01235 [Desulfobacteraceae bacterium]
MKNSSIPWWRWIIGIDFFLICQTVLYHYLPHFRGHRILLYPFNLGHENNLAAWWSGVCLFAAALLAYEICCHSEVHLKKAWLCLAILLLGLSKDEICSLHERIDGFRNLLPYAICAVTMLTYSLIKLFKHPETRKSAIYIAFAFLLFGSVAFQEFLEHTVSWPDWMMGIRVGIEEGTELIGIFLLLVGISRQNFFTSINSIQAIIPNLSRMKYISAFLIIEFFIHSVAGFLFPLYFDVYRKGYGNPLLWYPMAVFFMLFSESFWFAMTSDKTKRKVWILFPALFLLFSAGSVYNPFKLIFKLRYIMPDDLQILLFHVSIIFVMIAFCWKFINTFAIKTIIFVLLFSLIIFLEYSANNISWKFFLSGCFAYTTVHFFKSILKEKNFTLKSAPL